MSNFKVIILTALLHIAIAKHPICNKIEDIYHCLCSNKTDSRHQTTDTILRPIETIPGETGPQGEKGDVGIPGRQGPPGIIDYERISSMIEQKVSEEIKNNSMLNGFKLQLDDMSDGFSQDISKLQSHEGICGVKYEDKCFWIEIRLPAISYEKGREICKARGGVPANIYSKQHYEEITTYVRAQMPHTMDNYYFWLGMRAIPERSEFTLADGTPAPYLIWHEGFPSTDPTYTHFGMHVRVPRDLRYRDMYNYPTTKVRIGVLCEI